MSCSSWKSRQNCVFLALFFARVAGEVDATHAAIDATDDAREALEPAASSPSEGERGGEGFGDDGSSLRPRPRPGDFLVAFFEVFLGMTMMLTLRYLAWL